MDDNAWSNGPEDNVPAATKTRITRGDVPTSPAPAFPTPPVRLIGFSDPDFVVDLIDNLRNLGFDGRMTFLAVNPAAETDPVVIDISEATHPLFGGPTGWQLVRHFLGLGARVVVVTDPACAVPEDIPAEVGVFKGNPGAPELALALLGNLTWTGPQRRR
jgi:hypothetical protein